MPKMRQY